MLLANRKRNLYRWQGIRANGQMKQGILLAKHRNEVKPYLHQRGIMARKIDQQRGRILPLFGVHYHQELAHISYQLAWALESGIPLLQGLKILIMNDALSTDMIRSLIAIQTQIESGQTLTQACQQHPKLFNSFYCHQLAAGEKSGQLTLIFEKLAEYHRQRAEEIRQLKNILTYPSITLSLGLCLFIIFVTQIIPSFSALFQAFNAPIPLITQYCLHLSQIIIQWGFLFTGFLISLCCVLYLCHNRWIPLWDYWKLRLPYWGVFFQALATQRLLHALGLTLSAGLSMTQALKTLGGVTGNRYFMRKMPEIIESIQEGHTLKTALEKTGLFAQSMLQWIQLGEESGMLDRILMHIAKLNEALIKARLQHIKQCLEPMLMAFLGLSLGGLLLICYLPLFQLGNLL